MSKREFDSLDSDSDSNSEHIAKQLKKYLILRVNLHDEKFIEYELTNDKRKTIPFFAALSNFYESTDSYVELICPLLLHNGSYEAWSSFFSYLQTDVFEPCYEYLSDVLAILSYIYAKDQSDAFYIFYNFIGDSISDMNIWDFSSRGLNQLYRMHPKDMIAKFIYPEQEKDQKSYMDLFSSVMDYDYAIGEALSQSVIHAEYPLGKQSVISFGNVDQIATRLVSLSDGLLQLSMLNETCFISGGSLVLAVFGDEEKRAPDFDIDIWCSDKKHILKCLKWYEKNYETVWFSIQRSVVTVYVDKKTCPIQFIFSSPYLEPWEMIDRYDIDYVKAYFNGKELMVIPSCQHAWNTKIARPCKSTILQVRIDKAIEKGFTYKNELNSNISTHGKSRLHYLHPDSSIMSIDHISYLLSRLGGTIVQTVKEVRKQFKSEHFNASNDYIRTYTSKEHLMNEIATIELIRDSENIAMMILKHPIVFKINNIIPKWSCNSFNNDNTGGIGIPIELGSFLHQVMVAIDNKLIGISDGKVHRDDDGNDLTPGFRDDEKWGTFMNVKFSDKTIFKDMYTGEILHEVPSLTKKNLNVGIEISKKYHFSRRICYSRWATVVEVGSTFSRKKDVFVGVLSKESQTNDMEII